MHTVRIYGDAPYPEPAQTNALLSEHEFVSKVEATQFARQMAADAAEHGETVTLDGEPVT